MITKQDALTCKMFYHVTARNRDGTAVRCRANGKCATWKTRPNDWRLPVKYGLRLCLYLTPLNADQWLTYDPTAGPSPAAAVGLTDDAPAEMVHDLKEEMGL